MLTIVCLMIKKYELDKFQVATCRLIDTLYGFFAGNHDATTYDNARAVCELVSGLTNYLQENGKLDEELSLLYNLKAGTCSTPLEQRTLKEERTLITVDMLKSSRTSSNFSKHADRDADKKISYNGVELVHFLYNMATDYMRLHRALIDAALLDHNQERLFPVKREHLYFNGNEFLTFYDDIYSEEPSSELSSLSSVSGAFKPNEDEYIGIPASIAVSIIFFEKNHYRYTPEMRMQVASEIKDLGIWPVETTTVPQIMLEPDM